jgi:RNA polymerase sigma factor (sigma-70 family)
MTNLMDVRPKESLPGDRYSSRATAPMGDGLDREIRYIPGLPYETWEELDLPSEVGPWRMLTAEEEVQLFRQMNLAYFHASRIRDAIRAGDDEPPARGEFKRLIERGDSLRDRLLAAFYKLNLALAGRFTNRQHPFDELASEGQFTILRAISRFDPERGFRFSTYAMHAIRRRILRFIGQRHRERQSVKSLGDELTPVDVRRWTLAYEKHVIRTTEVIERLLAQLTSRERYVLRSRFGWGREFEPRTLRDIAAELGVSRERVRQLEERALRKLRSLAETSQVEVD